MNIIFLTRHDPNDINKWSGSLFFIYNKLREKHNIEVLGTEVLSQMEVYRNGNFPKDRFITVD